MINHKNQKSCSRWHRNFTFDVIGYTISFIKQIGNNIQQLKTQAKIGLIQINSIHDVVFSFLFDNAVNICCEL